MDFDALWRTETGREMLRELYAFLEKRGFLAEWRVVGCELVVRRGEPQPDRKVAGKTSTDHQDQRTGSLAYQRVCGAGRAGRGGRGGEQKQKQKQGARSLA